MWTGPEVRALVPPVPEVDREAALDTVDFVAGALAVVVFLAAVLRGAAAFLVVAMIFLLFTKVWCHLLDVLRQPSGVKICRCNE